MAAIDRTAYPRFKPNPSAKELTEIYTPTEAEITLAYTNAKGAKRGDYIFSGILYAKALFCLSFSPLTLSFYCIF